MQAPLVAIASERCMEQTVAGLLAAAGRRGMRVFAVIDHQAAAVEAGLAMPPTQVAIIGNPRVGTAIMLDDPVLAIQLPLRVLIHEDASGRVWLRYADPEDDMPAGRLSADVRPVIAGMARALRAVAAEAAGGSSDAAASLPAVREGHPSSPA